MDSPGGFDSIGAFLAMGGYAAYVWPAFAVTALVLGGLWLQSLLALRTAQKQEALVTRMRRAGASPPLAEEDR